VEQLASDAAAQLAYLDQLKVSPGVDELALEFDDIAPARDDMLAVGELNNDEHRAVTQLDAVLSRMSGGADERLWTREAVASDARWAELRRQAGECLRAFVRERRAGA